MLRVLLTNDDGIAGEGLRMLALLLARHAQVLVVAPDRPNSATSHSITLHKPLRLAPTDGFRAEPSVEARLRAYECSGTPSDCVMLGALHLSHADPPHLVISGINHGVNVAQDLTYSGTVGAALEGAVIGIPSLAVSLDKAKRLGFAEAAELTELVIAMLIYGGYFEWQRPLLDLLKSHAAAATACRNWPYPERLIAGDHFPDPGDWVPSGYPGMFCLNINIPNSPLAEVAGICLTRAGYREYRDVVTPAVDPRGKPYYWIAGEKVTTATDPGLDTYAVSKGFISVTAITYDLTHTSGLDHLAAWRVERTSPPGSQ